MDFTFLFDSTRDLFSIGCNVTERRCDTSFYDLLASEARLCSYVAIALGQVPQDHWFSMGRLLVASRSEPILVSWSGSMFEYLMPLLVIDRKSTRLNSSHANISYAVFCLKKKQRTQRYHATPTSPTSWPAQDARQRAG